VHQAEGCQGRQRAVALEIGAKEDSGWRPRRTLNDGLEMRRGNVDDAQCLRRDRNRGPNLFDPKWIGG
jgi:hypothetical protein